MVERSTTTRPSRVLDAIRDLVSAACQGSGTAVVVDGPGRGADLVPLVEREAVAAGIALRHAVLARPAAPFEVIDLLLGGDPTSRTGQVLDLPALRRMTHRLDASCADGPLLLVVVGAEHVDPPSTRALTYLAKNLDARAASILLVAGEARAAAWLDDVAPRAPLPVDEDAAGRPEVRDAIAGLAPDAHRVLSAMAVLGTGASLTGVADLAGCPLEVAIGALDELQRRDLLGPTDTTALRPGVGPVVLEQLVPSVRLELHGRAAAQLRRHGADAGDVAEHLLRAAPTGEQWAVDVLRDAASRALASDLAPRAVTLLRRAIEEAADPAPVRLLALLGRAQIGAGDRGAVDTLRRLVSATTGVERADHQLRLVRQLALAGDIDEALAELDALDEALDPDDEQLRALAVRVRTARSATCRLSVRYRGRAASVLSEVSTDPESLPGDPDLLAELAYEHALVGTDRTIVQALGRRALRSFSRRLPSGVSVQGLFVALLAAHDVEAARRLCDHFDGASRLEPLTAHRRGSIALLEGDLDRAVAWSSRAVAEIEWVAPMLVPGARAQLARAMVRAGDLEGAADVVELPGGDARWCGNVTFHPMLLARAEVAAARGAWELALHHAQTCAEFSEEMGTLNPAVVPWHPVAARAHAHLGQIERAEEVLVEAVRRAEAFGNPVVVAELRDVCASLTSAPLGSRAAEVSGPQRPVTSDRPAITLLGTAHVAGPLGTRRLRDDVVDRAVCAVALAPSGLHDEVLAEALWPDGDPAVGRTRLRNVLSRIRHRHGEVVVRHGRTIQLADDVWVDVREFERLAASAMAADDEAAEQLGAAALALHHGELCPMLPFEAWAAGPRSAVRLRWLGVLDHLAAVAARRGDLTAAMERFEDAVAAEPWDEERYLDAAQRLLDADRCAAADAVLRRCEAMCAELGVPVSARYGRLRSALG